LGYTLLHLKMMLCRKANNMHEARVINVALEP